MPENKNLMLSKTTFLIVSFGMLIIGFGLTLIALWIYFKGCGCYLPKIGLEKNKKIEEKAAETEDTPEEKEEEVEVKKEEKMPDALLLLTDVEKNYLDKSQEELDLWSKNAKPYYFYVSVFNLDSEMPYVVFEFRSPEKPEASFRIDWSLSGKAKTEEKKKSYFAKGEIDFFSLPLPVKEVVALAIKSHSENSPESAITGFSGSLYSGKDYWTIYLKTASGEVKEQFKYKVSFDKTVEFVDKKEDN